MSSPELEAGARAMRQRLRDYRIEPVQGGEWVVLDARVSDIDEPFREVFRARSASECRVWQDSQAFAAGLAAHDKARAGET